MLSPLLASTALPQLLPLLLALLLLAYDPTTCLCYLGYFLCSSPSAAALASRSATRHSPCYALASPTWPSCSASYYSALLLSALLLSILTSCCPLCYSVCYSACSSVHCLLCCLSATTLSATLSAPQLPCSALPPALLLGSAPPRHSYLALLLGTPTRLSYSALLLGFPTQLSYLRLLPSPLLRSPTPLSYSTPLLLVARSAPFSANFLPPLCYSTCYSFCHSVRSYLALLLGTPTQLSYSAILLGSPTRHSSSAPLLGSPP